jgi:hypothetical protein
MNQTKKLIFGILFLVLTLSFASAVVVDADYITIYSGESGKISVEIENNENFDIEEISLALELSNLPFTSVGSSEKDVDDIDEDDDDRVSFTLRASTDIVPGDYNIPYVLTYTNAENNSEDFEKTGSFGLRVSAKTDLDFALEIRENAIVGNEGRISLEVINKGLGEIKSVSVQIFPNGFELLSKDKIFVGTVSADDTDLASFDVIYKSQSSTLTASVEYKDFDNNVKIETVEIPFNVYTKERAIELGLIKKSNVKTYTITFLVLFVVWFFYRRRKKNKRKDRK